jgi:DNA-binding NarL/FixJ family response regulator
MVVTAYRATPGSWDMTFQPSETHDEISVVLVDDHDLFRGGLRDLLEDQGLKVVGEADSGERAVEVVAELAPDVAVMDLNMPGIGGVEATRQIALMTPATSVLVLTIASDEEIVMQAMMAGASSYLLKDASVDDLTAGIRAAAAGESSIAPPIAAKLLTRLRDGVPQRPVPRDVSAALSARQIEVLRLLAEGMGNAEIARELYISPKTVKNHIASILAKLQMDNRIQAAVYAVKSGLV